MIESISLPMASHIEYRAFANCASLKQVCIPRVNVIQSELFIGCVSLTDLEIGAIDVPLIVNLSFRSSYIKNVTIYNRELSISSYDVQSLEEVNIPNAINVTASAFNGCGSLSVVRIPSVEYISLHSFFNCTSIVKLECPKVILLGSSCIRYCESLVEIDLPNVRSIGSNAFCGCTGLKRVNIPDVEILSKGAFKDCKSLETLVLQNVKMLETETFAGMSSLKKLDLCNVLSIVGDNIFTSCTSLEFVNLSSLSKVNTGDPLFINASAELNVVLGLNPPRTFLPKTFPPTTKLIIPNPELYDNNIEIDGDEKKDMMWCGVKLNYALKDSMQWWTWLIIGISITVVIGGIVVLAFIIQKRKYHNKLYDYEREKELARSIILDFG